MAEAIAAELLGELIAVAEEWVETKLVALCKCTKVGIHGLWIRWKGRRKVVKAKKIVKYIKEIANSGVGGARGELRLEVISGVVSVFGASPTTKKTFSEIANSTAVSALTRTDSVVPTDGSLTTSIV